MGINNPKKSIKYINFDLDTKELSKIFPNGTSEPYALLKKFFEDKGFEHRQYSGYISKEPLSQYQIEKLAEELGKTFTWLNTCMQKFDVSNIVGEASIMEQIAYGAQKQEKINKFNNIHTYSQKTAQIHTITPKPKSRRR